MAEIYDETRTFDRASLDGALDFIADSFPPRALPNIFYPGIGTGRIAIPLAEKGFRITGIDLSPGMLAVLARRLADTRLPISFLMADVADAPFPDATFDLALAVHFFHLMPNWRKAVDEVLRVTRPGGSVLLMYTGYGTEIPLLNARYKELCAQHGSPVIHAGARSSDELVRYLEHLGCEAEWIRDRWQWTARARFDTALAHMTRRAYSFTNVVADNVHAPAIEALRTEFRDRLTTEAEVPNQIQCVVISRPQARGQYPPPDVGARQLRRQQSADVDPTKGQESVRTD